MLRSLAASGNWQDLRILRKRPKVKQGRMQDLAGNLVDSNQRAQSLAQYFSEVQWQVRHVTLVSERSNIYDALDVATHKISSSEVERAAKKIKAGRAMGIDGIPSEFWKFLCTEDRLLQWLTNFCDHAWQTKQIPQE